MEVSPEFSRSEAATDGVTLLVVPGWQGSGPNHWQSLWMRELPSIRSADQQNWEDPICSHWVDSLHRAALGVSEPVVLVAHSLGCLTVAHWAVLNSYRIFAALLVAPPNVTGPNECARAIAGFGPIPRKKLAFPSVLVGSEDDSYASIHWTRELAMDWGSEFVNAGRVGHINVQSGHGPWPEGKRLLTGLLDRASRQLFRNLDLSIPAVDHPLNEQR